MGEKEGSEVGGTGSAERVCRPCGDGLGWREEERIRFPAEKRTLT